ncbi:MAG: hypothetical protein ACUVWS_19300, partial [Roseiflexus sp.]
TERFTDALEEAGRVFGDGGVTKTDVGTSGSQAVFASQTTSAPFASPHKQKDAWVAHTKDIVDRVDDAASFVQGFTKFAHLMRSDKGSIGRLLQLAPGPIPKMADQFGDSLQAVSQSLHVGPHGSMVKLLKSKEFGWGLAFAGTALTLYEKYQEGQLTWQVAGAETTKTGVGMLIGSTGWGSVIMGANAGVQITGALFNAGTEAIAGWVAGPEYDARITENAQRMSEGLEKMDLMRPINKTIDVLWQGQFDKALPTFWESTVDIGEGFVEYANAAGDQLAIIGVATSEKLTPVIDQTGRALQDAFEEGAATFGQMQEQAQQVFAGAQQFVGSFFKLS